MGNSEEIGANLAAFAASVGYGGKDQKGGFSTGTEGNSFSTPYTGGGDSKKKGNFLSGLLGGFNKILSGVKLPPVHQEVSVQPNTMLMVGGLAVGLLLLFSFSNSRRQKRR